LGIDVFKQRELNLNSVLDIKLREFRSGHSLVAVYAGTLGDAYDMDLLLSAVVRAAGNGNGLAFVVAGDGPRKKDVDAYARKYPNHLLFLGAIPPDDLATLYQNADVGLMTYVSGSTVAMPVKFFDYLVGGLAVLSSLQRDVHKAIDEHQIGMNYRASDLSDFLRCLNVMANNTALLQAFKAAAFNLAEEYDTAKQYGNFCCFVERVCAT
jgi:glycosyltransferase involved in cell wall biosynthesis